MRWNGVVKSMARLSADSTGCVSRIANLFLAHRALLCKKRSQKVGAIVRQYATSDVDSVVQTVVSRNIIKRNACPGFGVQSPEHQAVDSGEYDGSGAHRARFQCDVQRAFIKPPASHRGGCGGQRDHFGVGGGIVQHFPLIPAATYDSVLMYDNSAHRYVARFSCGVRLSHRQAHEGFVLEEVRWMHVLFAGVM